ncbi:hypothetical protein XA68_15548 [Ophiocordyceps unilateralis]|uniref:MARVEL domain-containing protein n=1 Tax=Ophiocordyceps unilateralis TaxID=268505 RepID=A0A2A9PMG6_OPHUN|nr:hypothetical protein XA68_15548 [Ophiocordyceps unilateralis]
MGRTSVLSLRIFQGLLATVNLSLSAYVVNWYLVTTIRGSPPSVGFLVFAALFSILSILYLELVPRLFPRAGRPSVTLGVEATNAIFYFAAFIAHAVYLGSLAMCHGAVCTASRVDSVVAASAFCAWVASTILTARDMFVAGLGRPGDKPAQMREP